MGKEKKFFKGIWCWRSCTAVPPLGTGRAHVSANFGGFWVLTEALPYHHRHMSCLSLCNFVLLGGFGLARPCHHRHGVTPYFLI